MKDLRDTEGLLNGLHFMCDNMHDTKIVAYLALNTTAELSLSLKNLSHTYTGNYAQEDIKDISKIPLTDLLEYNLVDCCATNWVYDKYYPKMVEDDQLDIYNNLFMPSQKVLIQSELTGLPLSM